MLAWESLTSWREGCLSKFDGATSFLPLVVTQICCSRALGCLCGRWFVCWFPFKANPKADNLKKESDDLQPGLRFPTNPKAGDNFKDTHPSRAHSEELIDGARTDAVFQSRLKVMDIDESDLHQLLGLRTCGNCSAGFQEQWGGRSQQIWSECGQSWDLSRASPRERR